MNSKTHTWLSLLKTFSRTAFVMALILLPALFSTACTDDLKISTDESVPGAQENLGGGTKLYAYIRLLPVEDIYTRDDNNITDDQYGPDPDNQYGADFEAGNPDDESKISNFLIIFYDKYGDYLAHYTSDSFSKKVNETELENDPDLSKNEKDEEDEPEEGVIEKIGWNVLIPLEIAINDPEFEKRIEAIDSYFVIVNYDDDLLEADSEGNLSGKLVDPDRKNRLKKLEEYPNDIKSISVGTYQYKDKDGDKTKDKGFLMTTAGKFDKDGKYWYYDPKPKDNDVLFKSKQEAQKNAITVYVERLAAKIDFKINKIEKIDVLYDETDVYSLVFNPISWGLEATEEYSWLNKNIFGVNNKSDYKAQNLGNNYPSDFGDWSDYYNNRVFWATSYKFGNKLSYPVKGNEGLDEYSYGLSYQTFGEIIDGKAPGNGNIKSGNGIYVSTEKLYLLEHTFKDTELTRAINPYAVPTSVVLCGQYSIKEATPSTDKEIPDGRPDPDGSATDLDEEILKEGFYLRYVDMERTDYPVDGGINGKRKQYQYHIYLCDKNVAEIDETNKETGKPVGYKPSEELLKAMLKEQFMIWEPVRDEEGNIIKDEEGEIVSFQPVRDNKNGLLAIINTYTRHDITDGKWIDASNTYTLQLTSTGSDLYYKTSGKDSFHLIDDDSSLSTANKALQKQLGYAQYYWRGYAFFYAPILHYAGNEDLFTTGYKGLFNYDMNTDGSYKKNSDSNDLNYGNYIPLHKTGDFGVVRNTIYDFCIKTIEGLGYGIPGEDIIPLPEPRLEHDIYYFDLELKILPWKQFNYTFDI